MTLETEDFFPWGDHFKIGLDEIDVQHKQLIKLINQFSSHLLSNSNENIVEQAFIDLTDYADYHFSYEENVWREHLKQGSHVEAHHRCHLKFITSIQQLKEQDQQASESTIDSIENILLFLSNWLTKHILEEDMYLGKIVLGIKSGLPLKTAEQQAEVEQLKTRQYAAPLMLYSHLCSRAISLKKEVIERKLIERELKLKSRIFTESHEGIIITDANNTIIDVNTAFCEITGYYREDIIGQNPRLLSSGKHSPEFYTNMWHDLIEYDYWHGEVWDRKKDGEIYAELLTISVLKDDNDNITNYIGVFFDITKTKQQQEQLSQMAHYDVLTGLPNRTLFVDRFNQAIAHSHRTNTQLAICFLDLDNFKPVNDNFGHDVGDKLLIEVAKRISENIREEDTVSRQGGDEFALLLGEVHSYVQCEQTLQRLHHSLAQPFLIDDHPHKITASSGVTLFPADEGDIDTLLRHADQAMYQAKLYGKNRYHLFNPEHDQLTIQKHHYLEKIQFALVNREFQLFYQPKVNMRTGEVYGAEALIRWIHPENGIIPPLDFLPVLEGTELEIEIGNWVINEAIKQIDLWQQQGITLEVSVNIASHHLLSESFFKELDSALKLYPEVNSRSLQLEILESSALHDLNKISNVIETCQGMLGVNVALDDFGTGYSSLAHLRTLTANTIKIDQSFVRCMLDDPSDFAIIDGVIGLADSFNREVVAEGVETTNHGLMLLVMGCEEAQGYGIAKPMPANDFPQWLNEYHPNQDWLICGNKYRSPKETKLELFKLMTKHWKDHFTSNIQSPQKIEHWPIINNKRCPCGTWLKRAKQEQLFTAEDINQLDNAHNTMHLIANDLFKKYQDGEIDSAREGLTDLQTAFENMINTLELFQ